MSQQNLPPPPPTTLPEQPRFPRNRTRYNRPRTYFSRWGLAFGIVFGILLGLSYAWLIAPIEEFDTEPYQLRASDKNHYAVAIILEYQQSGDLARAVNKLIELRLGEDPIQAVADVACQLASIGYVDSTSGLNALRAMKTFYQLQGRTGCADLLVADVNEADTQVVEVILPTNTPTIPPPPSKTPTPDFDPATATPRVNVVPTISAQRDFEGRVADTFCNPQIPALIEVFVVQFNGDGIPGETVRVRWEGDESQFVTGLKLERGESYADFQMEEGKGYTIDMPSLSDPVDTPLVAESCFTENGDESLRSYRVVFRQVE
jgi:hypothetical protein